MTVLEVSKPAFQGTVDVFDDRGQTPAIAALGFGSNGILELSHTFRARPACAPLKMIAEKVKAFSGKARIHQSGFIRVQSKSSFCGQPTEEIQSPAGFGLTAAQNHKIIRIADHLKACGCHGHVDRVEIEIGKQGAYHRSLRAAFLGSPQQHILQNILLEEGLDQIQHAPVSNIATDIGHQRAMWNAVEVGFYVGIHHARVASAEESFHFTQCVLASHPWAESITVTDKDILEDGFDHHPQCSLNDSVTHTGYSQRSLLLAAGLINICSANRSRSIGSRAQSFGKPRDLFHKVFFEVFDTLMIRAGTTSVALDRHPCGGKGRRPLDLIDQAEPYASLHPLSEGLQHAFRPHMAFHPPPIFGDGFSRLPSPFGHYHGLRFVLCSLHSSTFLHPFAPRALPRFHALMGALTPVQGALRTLHKRNEHPPRPEQVSLVNTARTSLHSVTNHLTRPAVASMLSTQRSRLPDFGISGLDFTLHEEARRYVRPKRVRLTTDCKFASGCFPPRLATTQLPLAVGSGHLPREDLHLSDRACSQAHSFRRRPESRKSAMNKQPAVYILASKRNGTLCIGVNDEQEASSDLRRVSRSDVALKLALMGNVPQSYTLFMTGLIASAREFAGSRHMKRLNQFPHDSFIL